MKGFGEWNTYQDLVPKLNALTGEDFIKNTHIVNQFRFAIEGFTVPKISASELPDDSGKLKHLESWLKKNGIENEATKDILRSMKDAIFETLTNNMIEGTYSQLINEIYRRITKMN